MRKNAYESDVIRLGFASDFRSDTALYGYDSTVIRQREMPLVSYCSSLITTIISNT